MNIEPIIAAVRQRVPLFGERVFGAADWKSLPTKVNPDEPAAYVIPTREEAGELESVNGYRQTVTNVFSVTVIVDNSADERGQKALRQLETIRKALFLALLGWDRSNETDDFSPIVFESGYLTDRDSARLMWTFEFSFESYIGVEETRQGVELGLLPSFEGFDVGVDCTDPSQTKHAPDGRLEGQIKVNL